MTQERLFVHRSQNFKYLKYVLKQNFKMPDPTFSDRASSNVARAVSVLLESVCNDFTLSFRLVSCLSLSLSCSWRFSIFKKLQKLCITKFRRDRLLNCTGKNKTRQMYFTAGCLLLVISSSFHIFLASEMYT